MTGACFNSLQLFDKIAGNISASRAARGACVGIEVAGRKEGIGNSAKE